MNLFYYILIFHRQEEKDRLSIHPKAEKTKKQPKKKRNREEEEYSDLEDMVFKKRKDEKQSDGPKKKKGKTEPEKSAKELAKERALKDLEMASMTRAKISKSILKPKRIRACPEDLEKAQNPTANKKGFSSKFAFDLTNTSKKGVKKLRYDANKAKKDKVKSGKTKISHEKLKNKAGLNKFNKGKVFGKPREKKNRKN